MNFYEHFRDSMDRNGLQIYNKVILSPSSSHTLIQTHYAQDISVVEKTGPEVKF